jgi:hypothetical protein
MNQKNQPFFIFRLRDVVPAKSLQCRFLLSAKSAAPVWGSTTAPSFEGRPSLKPCV